jgi:hypothetical protein
MAGENFLPVQYYHDDQQLVTESLVATPAAGVPILYADRDLIIDSITVGTLTASSGGASATIQKTTAATRNNAGAIVPASPGATLSSIMGTGTIAINAAGTVFVTTESATTSLSNEKNKLDAGNWLFFVPVSVATALAATIQIRFRSRPK